MRRILAACAVACAMSIAVLAQDTKITSDTKVKADDAKVVAMTGCLQRDTTGNYTLLGSMVAGDDQLRTRTKVETDVDKDRSKVTTSAETKVDDGKVGTTGRMTTYGLTAQGDVALSKYVGQQVQIAAITVDPDHKDAEVKIEDRTKVDPDRGDDSSKRTKTEVEIGRGAIGEYAVVSIKSLGSSCR